MNTRDVQKVSRNVIWNIEVFIAGFFWTDLVLLNPLSFRYVSFNLTICIPFFKYVIVVIMIENLSI